MADLAAGRPIAAAEEGYLNLIHVDDAAAVVAAAETGPQPPRTYLVSDGHPCRRRDFYRHQAALLGQPEPEFVEPAADTPKSDRARDNKRIRNTRMLQELGVPLEYPSYREGLAAMVAGKNRP
jgi:nucleoside-diphosphate-sugar epimerase